MPGQQPSEMKPCEGALMLARVGTEVVLASELIGGIDEALAREGSKLSPEAIEAKRQRILQEVQKGISELATGGVDRKMSSQTELQREMLIRQLLMQQIATKLIYCDARQTIPEENFPQVEENLSKKFDEIALEGLLKRYRVGSRRELDQKLRTMGSSLEKRRRAFVQKALADGWTREQIKPDQEPTYNEMLEFYHEHLPEFETVARARWQELLARFSKHDSKAEAYAAITWMGNQVLAGVPMEQVAGQHSDGITASEGGHREWTDRGSLVCEQLDHTLFELPPGQLSKIVTSKNGYHIVRVIEREDVKRAPFLEVQVEIKKKIRDQRIQQQYRAYVSRLQEQVPVWTIFDDRDRQRTVAGRRDSQRR